MIIRIDDVVAAKNALKQTGPTDDPASQIAGVPGAGQLGDAGMPPM